MDRIEKIIILITLLGLSLICGLAFLMTGCQTPYNVLSVDDVEQILESEGDTICLDDGFDRICAKTIPGPAGKDGKDGKDGRDGMHGRDGRDGKDGTDGKDGVTLIAVHEMRIEVIVEKIIEMVVVEEFVKEVPVEVVVERVVVEYVDREVPIEVFVERTVEIIKEVLVEVPGEKVFVEVPGEKVFVEVPVEEIVESITQDAIYTEEGYDNPPEGFHRHTFTHTHDGVRHTHEIIHPDGEQDDWDREHDGWSGLSHD